MNDALNDGGAHDLQSTVDSLLRYFHDVADDKCLLWVNPAQSDPFETAPLVEEHRVRVPINHPRFDVQRAPYLVPLSLTKSAHTDLLTESVERAWRAWTIESLSAFCGQPIAGWVAARAPGQAIANHWARRCHLHRRQGLSKLLRFHDPGVREWLWTTLTEQQRHAVLGPADSLLAIGRGHSAQRHARSTVFNEADVLPGLVLDEKQWAQVDDYATVHAAWIAWSAVPDKGDKLPPNWEQGVFSALAHAASYGVRDPQDRELFAMHALQLGSGFHLTQRMRPVWERTLAGHYYGSALEEVIAQPADRLHSYMKST
jgi:hypothetical protein